MAGFGPFVLGTAQFGTKYGIANRHSILSNDELLQLIDAAWKNDVRCFDTAKIYGNSEERLGNALKSLGLEASAKVISKYHPSQGKVSGLPFEAIISNIELSVARCGGPLYGLLLHSEADMALWESSLKRPLSKVKERGLVKHFGVSVYSSDAAKAAILNPDFQLIQMPLNVFDQRAKADGLIALARENGKTMFFRSALLQGATTFTDANLPATLAFGQKEFATWWNILGNKNPVSVSLSFAARLASGFPLVVGVDSERQLLENIEHIGHHQISAHMFGALVTAFGSHPNPKLINPSLW